MSQTRKTDKTMSQTHKTEKMSTVKNHAEQCEKSR
jgi:hypothetical protein